MSLLIVDGYNIINSWPEFESLRNESMELARLKLVEILEEFTPLLWPKIIVVFDAYLVKGKPSSFGTQKGVEVVFTGEGQSADAFIERLVTVMSESGEEAEVASSDYLEQRVVLWKGGRRLSARELRRYLKDTKVFLRKKYKENTFRNVLDEGLSEKTKKVLEDWRRR
jgi:predicted RNA-binding protein with PIN domain